MDFQFVALDHRNFEHLFGMKDEELAEHRVVRFHVDKCPDIPCRTTLEDAPVGETALLVNYTHQKANTPYHASHAVFVRENVETKQPTANEIPQLLRHRLLSLRAFDKNGMIVIADTVEGTDIEPTLKFMLRDEAVAEVHVHYAKPGCFAARVVRA